MVIVWVLAIIGALFLIFKFLSVGTVEAQPVGVKTTTTQHPLRQTFSNLDLNQRLSIVNMLQLVGRSDLPKGNIDKELQYLNSVVDILGVRADACRNYYNEEGQNGMTFNLNRLSQDQKHSLCLMAWDMIICDGRPNEKELETATSILYDIGITQEEFAGEIKKAQAFIDYFKL